MIFLILFAIFTIIGVLLLRNDNESMTGISFMVIGVMGLLFFLILIPAEYYGIQAEIRKFNAVKTTFEESRESGKTIENAAIQIKIAEVNEWLASKQYWNNIGLFDIFIPDTIDMLLPIK